MCVCGGGLMFEVGKQNNPIVSVLMQASGLYSGLAGAKYILNNENCFNVQIGFSCQVMVDLFYSKYMFFESFMYT